MGRFQLAARGVRTELRTRLCLSANPALLVRFVSEGGGVMGVRAGLRGAQFQVLWAVVVTPPVFVVDGFARTKFATKHLFHDVAVSQQSLPVYRQNRVPVDSRSSAFPNWAEITTAAYFHALARAKAPSGSFVSATEEQVIFAARLAIKGIRRLAARGLPYDFHSGHYDGPNRECQPSP